MLPQDRRWDFHHNRRYLLWLLGVKERHGGYCPFGWRLLKRGAKRAGTEVSRRHFRNCLKRPVALKEDRLQVFLVSLSY